MREGRRSPLEGRRAWVETLTPTAALYGLPTLETLRRGVEGETARWEDRASARMACADEPGGV